jgi:ATP-dependent Clp protease ATP-binding subunit ClpA
MGARPLARLVQEEILGPLGDEILFGALENGGTADVDTRDGRLAITTSPNVEQIATD